ncbi:MAG: hypothetical protein LC789_16880 [Actinobacteria bacterium]|nr:hypothetical protein [Actinomycetota bacterium]MCA1722550.1 hypothetical protein [Actinomycetota bacterium]
MSAQGLDDPAVRTAMAAFLSAAAKLDAAAASGDEPRHLLDLAEAKTLAALQLRRELGAVGWVAPGAQTPVRSSP